MVFSTPRRDRAGRCARDDDCFAPDLARGARSRVGIDWRLARRCSARFVVARSRLGWWSRGASRRQRDRCRAEATRDERRAGAKKFFREMENCTCKIF